MGKSPQDNYRKMVRMAKRKGWHVPPANDVFGKDAWIRYWQGMAAYEKDPSVGRPVQPHRTGQATRMPA